MLPIPIVTDLEFALPVKPKALVPVDEIPMPFRAAGGWWSRDGLTDEQMKVATAWTVLTDLWFSHGLAGVRLEPREGVDIKSAVRAIGSVIACFDIKHEHKVANVAYLFDQWFCDWFVDGDLVSRIGEVPVRQAK